MASSRHRAEEHGSHIPPEPLCDGTNLRPQHFVLEICDPQLAEAGERQGEFAVVELHVHYRRFPSTASHPSGTIVS